MTCLTLNTSSWTQDQKNLLKAVVIELLNEAGEPEFPTITGAEVCLSNPIVNLATIITEQKVLDRYALDEAARETARLAREAEIAAAQAELDANTINLITLAQVDAQIDNISNLAEAKVVLKKIAKYLVAQRLK